MTADGEVVHLGGPTRERPGYDLVGCVVGSEGTLGIVTKALVRLVPQPEAVRTFLVIFDAVRQATRTVSAIVGAGVVPAALEMLDRMTIQAVEPVLHTGFPLDADAVLIVEVDGSAAQVEAEAAIVGEVLRRFEPREVRTATAPADREALWTGRKGAISALGHIRPNYYLLDGVVPRTKLPDVLDGVYAIAKRYGLPVANVFHAGDGNLHPSLLFDEREPGATQAVLDAGGEIMRLCVDAGGTISGEHGIGLEKRSYLPWIFSDADMDAMQSLRAAFASHERFNPCKIFPSGARVLGGAGSIRPAADRALRSPRVCLSCMAPESGAATLNTQALRRGLWRGRGANAQPATLRRGRNDAQTGAVPCEHGGAGRDPADRHNARIGHDCPRGRHTGGDWEAVRALRLGRGHAGAGRAGGV